MVEDIGTCAIDGEPELVLPLYRGESVHPRLAVTDNSCATFFGGCLSRSLPAGIQLSPATAGVPTRVEVTGATDPCGPVDCLVTIDSGGIRIRTQEDCGQRCAQQFAATCIVPPLPRGNYPVRAGTYRGSLEVE